MVCNYDISHILKPLKSSLTDACAHIYTHTHTGSFTFVVICFIYNVSYIVQYIDPITFPVVHSRDVTCSMNNKDDKSFLWAWSNENKNAILVHFMHLEISIYFQCLWNSRQECNIICQWFFYAPNPTNKQTLEIIRIHAWVGRHRPSFILWPKLVGTLNLLTATLKVKWKVNQTLPLPLRLSKADITHRLLDDRGSGIMQFPACEKPICLKAIYHKAVDLF